MRWEVLVSTRCGVLQSFVQSPDGHSLADGSYAAGDPQPTRIQLEARTRIVRAFSAQRLCNQRQCSGARDRPRVSG